MISYLLTVVLKWQVKCRQIFPAFEQKIFVDVIGDDKICVHYLEPVCKVGSK